MIALAHQDDGDLAALCRKLRRRDKTVAAIVAGPGYHQDRPFLHELHGGFRNRLTGAQHQRETRCAGGNGEPVGTLHLG